MIGKQVPSGWIACRIRDLFILVGGGTPSTALREYWAGPIPWISSADIAESGKIFPKRFISSNAIEESTTNLVSSGSIIVVTRVGLGKIGICETPLCFSQDCQALLFDNKFIAPAFVQHQLIQTARDFRSISRGTTISGITKKQLSESQFALAPINEQSRIVNCIDELFSDLDAGVAALERARANLKLYRISVLKGAIEGRLTAEWRQKYTPTETGTELLARIIKERRAKWEATQLKKFVEQGKGAPKNWRDKFPEPATPDSVSVKPLPDGWCWVTIGQCFNVEVGATPSRADKTYWHGSISWVSSGEVQFCKIKETRETISELGLANSSTKINPSGSVLLGMIGEGKTRGQAAILDIPAANNQNCAAIWVSDSGLPAEYVYYFFQLNYEKTRQVGSGNNQQALNKTRVQELLLPLPPQAEQLQIIAEIERRLSIADATEKTIDSALKRAARLRQAILKRAFEGRLVPQDPNDEPASALLERIRAERAKEKPVAPRPTRKTKPTDAHGN